MHLCFIQEYRPFPSACTIGRIPKLKQLQSCKIKITNFDDPNIITKPSRIGKLFIFHSIIRIKQHKIQHKYPANCITSEPRPKDKLDNILLN